MNRQIFEGRLLVNMAGAIIRQDTQRPVYGRINWELMYRNAEYHKVANIAYLGILGSNVKKDSRWRERFFDQYQAALRYSEIWQEAELEILALMDMKEVPCTILTSSSIRELYQLQEAAANNPLRLFIDPQNYVLAKGFLVDLGYETDKVYKGFGERMKRISGFCVEIYYELPFRTPQYEKKMVHLLEQAHIRTPYQFIRCFSLEGEFVFRAAEAVYRYATDELLIRDLLDLYIFYKTVREEINEGFIRDFICDLSIDDMTQLLMQLARMWFGDKADPVFGTPSEDMQVYDALENRILSRGTIKKETNSQALFIERMLEEVEKKEVSREKWRRWKKSAKEKYNAIRTKLRWVFPEYKYMCGLYPFIERIPLLLPVGWLRRDIRLLLQMIKND